MKIIMGKVVHEVTLVKELPGAYLVRLKSGKVIRVSKSNYRGTQTRIIER